MGFNSKEISEVSAIYDDKKLIQDICVIIDGKTKHLWGRYGQQKELELAEKHQEGFLPVLIGSGLGSAIDKILADTESHIVVLDNEKEILQVTGLKYKYRNNDRIHWIDENTAENAAARILAISTQLGLPLNFLRIPFYIRLNPEYYCKVENAENSENKNTLFWPRFKTEKPRILLLTSQYFLMGEIESACERLQIPFRMINLDAKESDLESFIKTIVNAITGFKPDFVLTVNHLGVDQEGYLNAILHKFNLPLGSWFVDNPHLILPLYARQADERTALFTWDSDRMESLAEMGFSNIFHLPLGTDQNRFTPSGKKLNPDWMTDISFVGNSMVQKTAKRFEASSVSGILKTDFKKLALHFGTLSEPSVSKFLKKNYPAHFTELVNIISPVRRLAYETSIIWQATLEYRLSCIKEIIPFNPIIAGDKGWAELLDSNNWKYHPELSYYDDLPNFYPCSKINFNCTSKQMKGAVNQRVFDVPACNGFLLTDHRKQISELFEPEKEIIFYRQPDEIPELAKRYLKDEKARNTIVQAARKRILAEHTYEKRMLKLTEIMRDTFN